MPSRADHVARLFVRGHDKVCGGSTQELRASERMKSRPSARSSSSSNTYARTASETYLLTSGRQLGRKFGQGLLAPFQAPLARSRTRLRLPHRGAGAGNLDVRGVQGSQYSARLTKGCSSRGTLPLTVTFRHALRVWRGSSFLAPSDFRCCGAGLGNSATRRKP